ncbi:hypothetical protein [Paracoccus litorisediminis]|uniref:HD domain-containing protein n=1 Tax=Paracoccus litorisediminis TaxID=2006130 RepID=A0A844HSG2_9RHOB|nr:hypothetical protein [Paracoccus litorisediminis]MTH62099.1 hypothetical protein [Paracoccus litorisediminis]
MDMTSRTMLLGSIMVEDIANPRPEDVDLQFMAYRLGTIVRFSGHPAALTVEEHQRLCRHLAKRLCYSEAVIEWAGLHDAHEYATGDLATPLQRGIDAKSLHSVQRAWDAAICGAMGIAFPTPATRIEVGVIDRLALVLEWQWALGRDPQELGVTGSLLTASQARDLFDGGVPAARRDELRHGRILLGG